MAQVSTLQVGSSSTSLSTLFRIVVERVQSAVAVRRAQSQLRWELNQYSDRELSDMGLSRSDIEGIVAAHRPA